MLKMFCVCKKSFLLAVTVSILVATGLPSPVSASKPGVFAAKIYEAESGVYQDFTLMSSTSASNGLFLRIGASGSVRWSVMVDHAGWYMLRFRYWSANGESVNDLKKYNGTHSIGFGYSSGWTLHEHPAKLQAGENILELAANWGDMDLDYVQIDSAALTPALTPQNNQYYTQFPRDLVAKVNTYGRTLAGVTADGAPMAYSAAIFPYQEDAWWVKLPAQTLSALTPGKHNVILLLDSGETLTMQVAVMASRSPAGLTIIAPDISHGNAILAIMPSGKILLIDCATGAQRDATLIPFLRRHNIGRIDYFIITHYHEDHDGSDRGEKIKNEFQVGTFYDNTTLKAGQTLDLEGTRIKIFNAASSGGDAGDLNPGSLAFILEYKGFVYHHGGDVYASSQAAMLNAYPAEVRAHVFSANHHFHGSSDVNFMRAMDPCLVLLQAEQAIYARSTYTTVFKTQTAGWLKANQKRFIEDAPALEVGTVVVRANGENDWTYETYFKTDSARVPYIPQTMEWSEDKTAAPAFIRYPDSLLTIAATFTEIEVMTDKNAYLRYSYTDQGFDDMPFEFQIGQGFIFHRTTLMGENGEKRTVYIRAQDRYGNATAISLRLVISFDLSMIPVHWYEPLYPDSLWKTGKAPLGYGNAGDQTGVHPVRTFYLRKTIDLADSITALGVLIKGHDGIVAYLNGVPFATYNMPTTSPGYDSYAAGEPAVPLSKVYVLDKSFIQKLVRGRNFLALEVHQADVANATLSADARVFNNIKIYSDLGGQWCYYDEGNAPADITYRELTQVAGREEAVHPDAIELSRAYPNPFNSATRFEYYLTKPGAVEVGVYNLTGARVATLLNDWRPAGRHQLAWEAQRVSSGIYFIRMVAGATHLWRKVLLLR